MIFLKLVATGAKKPGMWRDASVPDYFVFANGAVQLQLRKRTEYPATFAYVKSGKLYFGYGDEAHAKAVAEATLKQVPHEAFYDAEFLWGTVDGDTGTVTVQRDAYCTLPLFVGSSGGTFALANTLTEVCAALGHKNLAIDPLGLGEALVSKYHTHRTILKNARPFGERSRVLWKGERLAVQYAPDGPLLQHWDEQTSEPLEFKDRLEASIASRARKYASDAPFGAQLSMGLDSTTVGGYLAAHGHNVVYGTIGYPGGFAPTQRQKLEDFAHFFGTTNHYVADLGVQADFPLEHMHPASPDYLPFARMGEIYWQSFDRLAQWMAAQGVVTVFMGSGGDELCTYGSSLDMIHEGPDAMREHQDFDLHPMYTPAFQDYYHQTARLIPHERRIPVPLLPQGIVGGTPGHNNIFLQYNIWPVSPLADPQLFAYCQALPIQYRAKKNILRMYCAANGYPESLYNHPINEHFGGFFESAMQYARPALEALLQDSVLARAGFIDPQTLLQCFDDAVKQKDTYDIYRWAVTEHNLQRLGLAVR